MSAAPPLCRYCGKPLRKLTKPHWIGTGDPNPPLDKAECQKRTNEEVVSVRYGQPYGSDPDVLRVRVYTTWDGESYESVYGAGFFCSNSHAINFANLHARAGQATATYVAALTKQRERLLREAAE